MLTTTQEYITLDNAYTFLNDTLFAGELPACLIVYQRAKRYLGYFHGNRYANRQDAKTYTDEIALNPDYFNRQSDKEILSVLLHEMIHLWQAHCAKTPRAGYHDKVWAKKMIELGLMPSATGQPGGKQTGQKVSHYIIPGGLFDQSIKEFETTGKKLCWNSRPLAETEKKKTESKVKYTCPECDQNAWAKPNANLICGNCETQMTPQEN